MDQRDTEWKEVIEKELDEAERFFQTQAKIDEDYVAQKTTLDLTEKQESEIKLITDELRSATEERLIQLNDIMNKIKEMEEIQNQHYKIILKLNKIHNLHITIENLQRTLNCDEGSLTKDLANLKELAKEDDLVAAALTSIDEVYAYMVENGIPTMTSLQRSVKESANRARKAALLRSKTFWSYLTANFAFNFVPSNVKTIDDNDSFSLLREAELSLERGDLKSLSKNLESLKGFPREEVEDVLKEISVRQGLLNLLEVLSTESISLVKQLILIK